MSTNIPKVNAKQPEIQTTVGESGDCQDVTTTFFSPGHSVRSDFCIPRFADEYYFEVNIQQDTSEAG